MAYSFLGNITPPPSFASSLNTSLGMLTRLARLPSPPLFFPRTLATAARTVPWFVDQQYESSRQSPPHLKSQPPTTPTTTTTKTNLVPENAPDPVKLVHAVLARSPHLDQSALLTTHAIAPQPGPPLPLKAPQGRRKRGSTYGGDSAYDVPGTIWSWTVIAQVRLCASSTSALPLQHTTTTTNRLKKAQKIAVLSNLSSASYAKQSVHIFTYHNIPTIHLSILVGHNRTPTPFASQIKT